MRQCDGCVKELGSKFLIGRWRKNNVKLYHGKDCAKRMKQQWNGVKFEMIQVLPQQMWWVTD